MDHCSKTSFNSSSPFDCLLFDLDDTLYSSKLGIAEALRKNIDDFLVERCGFPEDKAPSIRVELFKTYGSSLAGLRALGYDIDADGYHSFVHGRLPYDLIKPDTQLLNLLRSITQRKIIFTNSDRNHAIMALRRLGIEDCFDQIICFETMNPNLSKSTSPDEFPVLLKPSMDAMKIALRVADVDLRRTLFLDDNVRNIAAGKAMGLRTALVNLLINPIMVKPEKKLKNHTNPLLESNLSLATEIQIKKSASLAKFLPCRKVAILAIFYHLEKEENARGPKAQDPCFAGPKGVLEIKGPD